MSKARSVTFIAKADVIEFLDSLESGLKSKVINRALRQYIKTVNPDDVLGESTPYQSPVRPPSEFEEFVAWLDQREEEMNRTYQILGDDDKHIGLLGLLRKFIKRRSGKAGRLLSELQDTEASVERTSTGERRKQKDT